MANNCFYEMKVAAKDAAAIDRLMDILTYKDKEFFIYRVFSAYGDDIENNEESGLYTARISGDVAWSCAHWLDATENLDEKDSVGGHYANLPIVCRALGIGVEVFSEEEGCEFQEHFRINHNGEIDIDDCEDWTPGYDYLNEDGTPCSAEQVEDGDVYDCVRNEEKDEGGIEDWGEFSFADEIYGEEVA